MNELRTIPAAEIAARPQLNLDTIRALIGPDYWVEYAGENTGSVRFGWTDNRDAVLTDAAMWRAVSRLRAAGYTVPDPNGATGSVYAAPPCDAYEGTCHEPAIGFAVLTFAPYTCHLCAAHAARFQAVLDKQGPVLSNGARVYPI